MYYICKLSNTYTVLNGNNFSSRLLEPGEIAVVKQLFPDLLDEKKMVAAVQVKPTDLKKLQNEQSEISKPGSKKS